MLQIILIALVLSPNQIHGFTWVNITNQYILFEVTAFNVKERAVLYDLQTYNETVIFLNGVTNIVSAPMYVMVHECCVEDFEDIMYESNIEYIQVYKDSVLKEFKDLQLVQDQYISSKYYVEEGEPSMDEEFLEWEDILLWVKYKIKKNPTNFKKIDIGTTYENRDLFVLKVFGGGVNKPRVFILGGEQGRDKMSPAVILSFIEQLLYTNAYNELLSLYDFYFMPVFNPDGYEYTFTDDMFFNKNRKHFYPEKICVKRNITAIGVNIDRNFFYSNSGYVEDAECDSVFLGHEPLSEEESIALSNFLNKVAVHLMAYINVRGFSSLLTVPYAQDNEFANNYAVLSEILLHASNVAFHKYNVSCNLCSTHNCFYNQTGNSPDWVKKNLNIPVVFTLYLKHADSFLPKINQVPTLLKHFGVIIKESLQLAYDIYGPLFNRADLVILSFSVVSLVILIMVLYF